MCQGFRNSKRNKAESLSLGVYDLEWKFSVKNGHMYHSSVDSIAGEEPRGSQAAGKEGR